MKNFFTLTLCFLTLSLTAQEAGCTYSIANNYSSTATVDDGTCVFGGVNVFDYDNDGNIAINDFIAMLSYFGDTDSDSDGVFDSVDECIDLTACNYQSNPTHLCYYLDVLGVCGGWCIEDADGDGICDWNCGENLVYGGYDYSTVQIGNQCWFSENCHYLPTVSPIGLSSWPDSDPYYYVYDYEGTDVAAAKSTSNYETYGVLYNWYAVMTEGICPSGWHIPSDGEWQTMEMFLGMDESTANSLGFRGSPVGDYLTSTSGWNDGGNGGNGSNSSGFNGLPGGYCHSNAFNAIGNGGYWWAATGESTGKRGLEHWNDGVHRGTSSNHDYAWSARCVKD